MILHQHRVPMVVCISRVKFRLRRDPLHRRLCRQRHIHRFQAALTNHSNRSVQCHPHPRPAARRFGCYDLHRYGCQRFGAFPA